MCYACLAFPVIHENQYIHNPHCDVPTSVNIIHHSVLPFSHFVQAGLRSALSFQQRWTLRFALASLWVPSSTGRGSIWKVASTQVRSYMSFETTNAKQQKNHLIYLCLLTDITSLTFDPETAHPNLSLSQSCTSVWYEEDKDTKDCQANPRRFHYYYCVLSHQGFTTGRHYWEVEVGHKTAWRLGVAREDVLRGEMASTGTSSGLWTLTLKGGSVLACTDPKPTKVNVSVQLVRIGVFLDCEKEEVSFYNAVTMAPIYTFTMGTVLVPLFPFYNPCDTDDGKNTAPIKIFNPSLWYKPFLTSLNTNAQYGRDYKILISYWYNYYIYIYNTSIKQKCQTLAGTRYSILKNCCFDLLINNNINYYYQLQP